LNFEEQYLNSRTVAFEQAEADLEETRYSLTE